MGCYGSSWNRTPAIDAIADTGCVWDRLVATDDQPTNMFLQMVESLDQTTHWKDKWQANGSIDLITDVKEIADRFEKLPFDRMVSLHDREQQRDQSPSEDIVDTQLGQLVAAAIERDTQQDAWSMLWLHSDFLTKRWDAPRYMALMDEGDQDSLAPSEEIELLENADEVTERVEKLPPYFEDIAPPSFQLPTEAHPDLVMSWMRTYGCQIRMLDVLIEILLTSLGAEDPRVLIVGTSGFQLGQHGWVGHRLGPLRSADIRIPLIVSDLGPLHLPQLSGGDMFPHILNQIASHPSSGESSSLMWSPEQWCQSDAGTSVITKSDRTTHAMTTPDWFYVQDQDQSEHLYLKPDDIDDFNNVARLRPDIIEQFLNQQKNPADD
ncbi:MAG: hypothetical protein CMM01_12700 [Rhodopirellula sp.]|nr:hypothetical protein [Rhodopirellula sp.]